MKPIVHKKSVFYEKGKKYYHGEITSNAGTHALKISAELLEKDPETFDIRE